MTQSATATEAVYLSDIRPSQAKWGLAILSVAHGVTHMQGALLPLVYPMLMRTMGFGYVQLGVMLTITRLIGGLLQSIWGTVARYVSGKNILVGENLGVAAGIGLCSVVQNYPGLIGTVTVGQVAASPHHPIASAMLSQWYSKQRRGNAQAIHFAMANVATVITPLIATVTLRWWGWKETLYVFTIPAVVVAVLLALCLPNEMVAPKAKQEGRVLTHGFFEPLKDPLVRRLIATASITAGGKGIGIVQTFLPLFFLNHLHTSASTTGLLFAAFTTTSVIGPVMAGRLSDRFNRSKFLSFLLLGACVLSVCMALFAGLTAWLLIPILVLFGLFVYGYSPVEQTIMADITSSDLQASAYSLFFGITFGISALWPVVLSCVLQQFGFTALFLVIALSYLIGAIIYMRGNWSVSQKR